MSRPIEEHALLADTHTAALVARDATIDFFCAPRFDAPPQFAALLGTERNGSWSLSPAGSARTIARRYAGADFTLETTIAAEGGVVRIIDFMPVRGVASEQTRIVRIVEGLEGRVPIRSTLAPRLDFGTFMPRTERREDGFRLSGAGDAFFVRASVAQTAADGMVEALFALGPGERAWFDCAWEDPALPDPPPIDVDTARSASERYWRDWAAALRPCPVATDLVQRSALVLRALVYAPTGGLAAAATTSLPERTGGALNWDYRYGWVRDTAFAAWAFLAVGAVDEASRARDWMLRTTAGRPEAIQSAYRLDGYRRVVETVVEELPGWRGSRPVRTGNAAATQSQMDVYGEMILTSLGVADERGEPMDEDRWALTRHVADGIAAEWNRPGNGFWETRGRTYRYIDGRAFSYAALDRASSTARARGDAERAERWSTAAHDVRASLLARGVKRGHFTLRYEDAAMDATALWAILNGVVAADDPRARKTVAAVERALLRGGYVYRSAWDLQRFGKRKEGAFLPCTGWLARAYLLLGRRADARAAFERLIAAGNDVGIFSEEWDVERGHQLGNTPQALTHAEVILCARALADAGP